MIQSFIQHYIKILLKNFIVSSTIRPENFYADGMQAAQVLALALPGVVPTNIRQTVVDYLVSDIRKQGTHLTTGITSTAELCPVLF